MNALDLVGFDAWGDGPSPAACQAQNVAFRTWYSSSDPSKDAASASALAAYAAAGIWSIINFENTTNDWQGGYSAGAANARHALAEYIPMGMPPGASVILSADMQIDPSDFPTVLTYYQGAASVLAPTYRCGCYGEQALIKYLKAQGAIQVGWLSMSTAWPNDGTQDHCDLVQTAGGTIGGVSIDWDTNKVDLSLLGCWKPGQLYPSTSSPAATPAAIQEDTMRILYVEGTATVYGHDGLLLWGIADPASLTAYQTATGAGIPKVQNITQAELAQIQNAIKAAFAAQSAQINNPTFNVPPLSVPDLTVTMSGTVAASGAASAAKPAS